MPAPVPTDPRSKQLLTALFWGGVALAPVAALILLVADGNGPLRFAAVLAILAVVLIGLSITLRTEGDGQQHAEELRAEIDELRRELRTEIVAAAQRGNQALNEVQRVQQALAGLRRTADAAGASVGGGEPVGGGRARVAAAEPEARAPIGERPAPASPEERSAGPGGVYGSAQPASHGVGSAGWSDEDEAGTGYGTERPAGAYPAERPAGAYPVERSAGAYPERPAAGSAGVYGGAAARPDQEASRPLGVVRHTETVHVTTRHTIVDGGGVGESGPRYGGYAAPWSAHQGERPRGGDRDDRPAPREEPPAYRDDRSAYRDGSGYRDDGSGYRDERPGRRDERDWGASRDERSWGDGGQQWESSAEVTPGRSQRADDTGEYWAQLRAGDRWAAVRDDDRGRELRVGERHAEVNADHSGTEYRMADRWASVRRDEPRRAAGGDEGWREGRGDSEGRTALPAGGVPMPEEWRPPRQREHQPEPVRGYPPEAVRGYQPEPARGYQPEPARGYQPQPAHGHQPEPEPYGRRHRAEDTGYGQPVQDPNNRWR
ncbi:hypothetical protein AB0M35_17625 [Micromonospora sp. NPDC051196]|uniref:hypothetical protein n=1 Tax=Micromonospora sp. NPDC051196 TaxID=3155281 RepID=UPI0034178391